MQQPSDELRRDPLSNSSSVVYEVHYATRSREGAAFQDRFPDENKVTVYAEAEAKRLDLATLIPEPDRDGKRTTRIYCCGPEALMNAAQRRARWIPGPIAALRELRGGLGWN